MITPRTTPRSLLTALLAALALVTAVCTTASTSASAAVSASYTGNATYFDALGSPYGGCGVPQANLDSQNFVALNVFNTPGSSSYNTRPVPAQDAAKMGAFANGLNCGRWVQVTIGDYCTGINDGDINQPFCRNGSWTQDKYNGATLNMLVADSCADPNGWCRNDPNHLDLAKDSLNRFAKDGTPVGDMYPNHWGNRHITWSYVPAPGYTGDISIGFMANAKPYWPAIAITHLANGIHGVEYFDGSAWQPAQRQTDMGQAFVIAPTATNGTSYRIRVRDADDALVQGGRTYSFTMPSSCSNGCSSPFTGVSYTTDGGTGGTTAGTTSGTTAGTTSGGTGGDTTPPTAPGQPSVTGTTSTTVSLTWGAATDNVGVTGYNVYRDGLLVASPVGTSYTDTGLTPSTAYSYSIKARDAAGNLSAASGTVTATTSATSGGGGQNSGCAASWHLDSQWNAGFGATVTVSNTGTAATRSWKVTWTWPGGQTATDHWNADLTQTGTGVTATSLGYNGSLAPKGTTTFGFNATGTAPTTAPALSCTAT
ncbi:cellulose binding domain-containing protein [Peterkaempfera bronchialis]|uniref:cellulose binding domain-containing protein n=1 Tax=Peterkaempfera bronchialis TaxID=2126346 RepID=UPI001E536EAD|nr:cellulose binding domain-containing protein [Peterkaempfera bronchialis]